MMPLTADELMALPEAKDYETKITDSGETIIIHKPLKFVTYKEKPDDIIMFTDYNGEKWFVDYHLEGGPYKRRALF